MIWTTVSLRPLALLIPTSDDDLSWPRTPTPAAE